jgi:putative ABC transport system permease protein
VLWFTAAITLIAGLVAGFGPGLPLGRLTPSDALKAGSPSGGSHRLRGRRVLVVVELGFAIVLLAGAGLMLKSFRQMNRRPQGFTPENILSMQVTLSGPRYSAWPRAGSPRVARRASIPPSPCGASEARPGRGGDLDHSHRE